MLLPKVTLVAQEERSQILSTIMLGFSADPLVRWFYPSAEDYLNSLTAFDAFCGGAIDRGSAYRTEHFEGAALWHAPGSGPDEERMVGFLQETVREEVLGDVFSVFEAMGECHPEEDCWYLPVIGVDPAHQGKGLGAALMKESLRRIDEAGLPAYLESSNPRNISLYKRHGFEAIGNIQFGDSPVITPMYRRSRR